jgi:hypothetical protein
LHDKGSRFFEMTGFAPNSMLVQEFDHTDDRGSEALLP